MQHKPVPALEQKLAQSHVSCPGPDAPKLQKRFQLLTVVLNMVSVMEDVVPMGLHSLSFASKLYCAEAMTNVSKDMLETVADNASQ